MSCWEEQGAAREALPPTCSSRAAQTNLYTSPRSCQDIRHQRCCTPQTSSPSDQPSAGAQEGTGAHPPLGWSLTVARSFCVRPLLCLPCWITLPTSRETLSWCSSSVSRSSLAVFFVMKCCLFWPAAPAVRSSNKRTTKDKQNKAQSSAKKYERMFSKPSAAQDTRELSGFQHTNINIDLTQI